MPQGPLGFPRLTDYAPFTSTLAADIRADYIKKSVSGFRPPTIVDSKGNNPYPKWDRDDTREEGMTGLYLKSENICVIEPRQGPLSKTHSEIANRLSDRYDPADIQIIPFSSVKTRDSILLDQGWFLSVNSSAGSMFAGRESEFGKARVEAEPKDVWPVVYTAWMTNHPHDTSVNFKYTYFSSEEEEVFDLANGYRELSFALGGLPEPQIRRT